MDVRDARAVLAALVSSAGHPEASEALPVVFAELDAARAEIAAYTRLLNGRTFAQIDQALLDGARAERQLDAARARVADRGAEVERLANEWASGLADGRGRHVPVRRAWPELADLLDTLIDD